MENASPTRRAIGVTSVSTGSRGDRIREQTICILLDADWPRNVEGKIIDNKPNCRIQRAFVGFELYAGNPHVRPLSGWDPVMTYILRGKK